jgi:hypothetical protein
MDISNDKDIASWQNRIGIGKAPCIVSRPACNQCNYLGLTRRSTDSRKYFRSPSCKAVPDSSSVSNSPWIFISAVDPHRDRTLKTWPAGNYSTVNSSCRYFSFCTQRYIITHHITHGDQCQYRRVLCSTPATVHVVKIISRQNSLRSWVKSR